MNQKFHPPTRAYVEHVAIRVKDIHWHIRFFDEVLGMDVREIDGPPENPSQYWTVGGMQLMSTPDFQAPPSNEAGWLAHLGVMVDDPLQRFGERDAVRDLAVAAFQTAHDGDLVVEGHAPPSAVIHR